MKVWLLIGKFANGGLERIQITIADELSKKAVDVSLVSRKSSFHLNSEIPKAVSIKEISPNSKITYIFKLIKYWLNEKPTHIFTTANDISCVAILLKLVFFKKTAVIATQHLSLSEPINKAKGLKKIKMIIIKKMMQKLLLHADKIVAVSNGVKNDLCMNLKLQTSQVDVIYNPVITDHFKQKLLQTADFPWAEKDQKVIVYAGRISPEKRLDILLAAYEDIHYSTNARLLIIGDGPMLGWVKQKISEKKWGDHCKAIGFVINPIALIKQSDLLVLPSDYEGLPTILIEALGCGIQIISTDCPYGPSEILENGKHGQLIKTGDQVELASAIKKSLRYEVYFQPELLKQRANLFSVENTINAYLEILEKTQNKA